MSRAANVCEPFYLMRLLFLAMLELMRCKAHDAPYNGDYDPFFISLKVPLFERWFSVVGLSQGRLLVMILNSHIAVRACGPFLLSGSS